MIQTNKIKGRMTELEITQKAAAAELGIDESTFNRKLNSRHGSVFSLQEVVQLADLLELSMEQKTDYFFGN